MKQLKGADTASRIKGDVQEILAQLQGRIPTAAVVRVGEKPDDIAYERNAMKRIAAYGMEAKSFVFSEAVTEEEFLAGFQKINQNPEIDGILLLQPLPAHLNAKAAERLIDPAKDLDGISPVNAVRVFAGEAGGFAPCTAEAVLEVLHTEGIDPEGKRVVIVGRSMVVGRPLSMLFLAKNATVTICHTRTKKMEEICRQADILVAAAGKAGLITADFVGDGAVVIDVGIHVDENGNICGDVLFDGLEEKALAATPVPGGIGTVTTAVLAKHLAEAALMRMHADESRA